MDKTRKTFQFQDHQTIKDWNENRASESSAQIVNQLTRLEAVELFNDLDIQVGDVLLEKYSKGFRELTVTSIIEDEGGVSAIKYDGSIGSLSTDGQYTLYGLLEWIRSGSLLRKNVLSPELQVLEEAIAERGEREVKRN